MFRVSHKYRIIAQLDREMLNKSMIQSSRFYTNCFNTLSTRILMKIDYVRALQAQRTSSSSGFPHPYNVQAPFYLWSEALDSFYARYLALALKGLISHSPKYTFSFWAQIHETLSLYIENIKCL